MKNSKNIDKKTLLKRVGIAAGALVLVMFGWFLHGLVTRSGKPAGAAARMMGARSGPPQVEVGKVEKHPSKPPREYVGHVEAIEDVELKAQVDGYIDKVHFEEGDIVEKGDLLFTIERDRYKANVELRQANLDKAKAGLAEASKYLERLRNAEDRSVAKADMDAAERNMLQAKATVKQAKAELKTAKINLGYTQIKAPITGKTGKAFFTEGDYVSPSSGMLAKMVRLDPVRVVFSMTDREFIEYNEAVMNSEESVFQTKLRLPNGSVYSGFGKWGFVNNEIDPGTATVAVRKVFDNKNRLLLPGCYVTVLMTRKDVEEVPMVPQEAILTDKDGHYVFVVEQDQIVKQRRVELGAQSEGYRVVEFGLSGGETVITSGVQKVTPGQKVKVVNFRQQENGKK